MAVAGAAGAHVVRAVLAASGYDRHVRYGRVPWLVRSMSFPTVCAYDMVLAHHGTTGRTTIVGDKDKDNKSQDSKSTDDVVIDPLWFLK